MIKNSVTGKKINVQLLNEGFVSYRKDRTQSMDNFLTSFRNIEPLTSDEERELFDIIQNSDDENLVNEAKDRVIASCELFVYSIAKRYGTTDDETMDYISEGNMGLLEAMKGYNPNAGNKFLTYAVNYIRKYILDYKNELQFIKRPYWEKTNRIIPKIKKEFLKTEERLPTPDEIADIMMEKYKLKINNASDLYDIDITPLDAYTGEGNFQNQETLPITGEMYSEDENNDDSDYNRFLTEAILAHLPEKEQTVLKMHFGIDNDTSYTYEEIALKMGMSTNTVKNLVRTTLNNIRAYMTANNLSLSLS